MTSCSTSPMFFRRAVFMLVIVALQDVTHDLGPVKNRNEQRESANRLASSEIPRAGTSQIDRARAVASSQSTC